MKFISSKNLKYFLFLTGVVVITLISFNIYYTIRIHKQLAGMVSRPGRWPAGAYIYDPAIGFDFASNVSGFIGDGSFYVKSHQLGYRIGEHEDMDSFDSGGVLSLGCSFTYGDEVESNQTFTQLFADSLSIPAYNFGVCSFSYIHALLKAQKLKDQGVLDKLNPKYVILGCWKELLGRSRSPFPPIASKSIPLTASYIANDDGVLNIHTPLSMGHAFELMTLYRKEGAAMSFKKFIKIFTKVPRLIYVLVKNKRLNKNMREVKPADMVSDFDIYNFYFSGIEKIFSSYKSQIIVLYMPSSANDQPDKALEVALYKHPDFIFVNGLQALKKYGVSTDDYQRKHPQPAAHMAYAREIIGTFN